MVIHNATFMVRKELEADVILWLKGKIAKMEANSSALSEMRKEDGIELEEGINPRVSAMREAGGVSHEHADAASIAFQVEFPSAEAARLWSKRSFERLASEFDSKFGTEGMVFTSLFEVV